MLLHALAELMDADFHGGWTAVRLCVICSWMCSENYQLVTPRVVSLSLQMQEIHSSDVQWNKALELPMVNGASDGASKRARTE